MKLYLDPGHGGSDPGAQGNGLVEKAVVLDIALRIRRILTENYKDVVVKMSRTDDSTKSLQQRTNEANSWGATYYFSIHCNAFNGSAHGYEDYIHSSLSDASQTAGYRNSIHTEISRIYQLNNRGKKKGNFHVLRETSMAAMLTENGFIDNEQDAALMQEPSWRERVALGHVNGLAKAFNLQSKTEPNTIFRVIAGSFKLRGNAEDRSIALKSQGIKSFIDRITISGEQWYRVQAGAFTSRENAENRLSEVLNAGVEDAFIVTD
ncbi:N-acetylmuramoyl-L-alanine amidase [Virgibacillus sp. C22-A2]|uniref:N-acetylmuramoyl-L-alanine amidase n=1 Tax=Virgibacillus tibetensis TaxID=3042313 RepID=A0ABU6KFL4_9BACI|nr:N-acetylmuramoyl-L-alanine amidase [Virgibacillus sp. C22-A2]